MIKSCQSEGLFAHESGRCLGWAQAMYIVAPILSSKTMLMMFQHDYLAKSRHVTIRTRKQYIIRTQNTTLGILISASQHLELCKAIMSYARVQSRLVQ